MFAKIRNLLHFPAQWSRRRRVVSSIIVASLFVLLSCSYCAWLGSQLPSAPTVAQVTQAPTKPAATHGPTATPMPTAIPTSTPTPSPTATPQPTVDPTIAEGQTAQHLAAVNCNFLTKSVNAVFTSSNNTVAVTAVLGEQWDLSTAQNNVKSLVFNCFKGFYTSPHAGFVQDVKVLVEGPVTDQYGNTSTGVYGSADLTRATQQPFNWQNLDAYTAWDNQIYDSQYVTNH